MLLSSLLQPEDTNPSLQAAIDTHQPRHSPVISSVPGQHQPHTWGRDGDTSCGLGHETNHGNTEVMSSLQSQEQHKAEQTPLDLRRLMNGFVPRRGKERGR